MVTDCINPIIGIFLSNYIFIGIEIVVTFISDGPIIKSVGPNRLTTVNLYGEAWFDCEAEANPTPSYQWLQRISGGLASSAVRSNDARLHIRNATYHHQGEYICRVANYIGGKERPVQSDPVALQVVGKPDTDS
ncbi:hypothetical protein AAG570_001407 [Ranatra chinensis]|uniref:Ig-like domain-containing protein n=1 Tax=Ranatra chinensis TaxID=642074 RepID=A0ABD0YBS9_9HEMI